jgi:micrococcal nuclease
MKKLPIGTVLALTGASLIGIQTLLNNTSYTVTHIYDGDTFETQEKQVVRLNSVNAPEKGFCGYETSKQALEKLIGGKKVFLKVVYRDAYDRMIANVYTGNGAWVNEEMARSGDAIVSQKTKSDKKLIDASQYSLEKSLGLQGLPCTQETNIDKPTCTIKGNLNSATHEKIYHMKGCNSYPNVKVQLFQGDQWFCTEKEAQNAGFKKAETCP